ncbi:choice-of-anchor C family protein [Streptomyces sp. BE20]|uniref:choice-of-anchor C family protein n=1 Tax=Streptomycetaceae TaxID=2062 RepID=UPI002E7A4342|nr:choice-of-anchor C family protein [Streptomyces sp. BE20]MEE1821816.1 choice-of-anchor C family protein [Streptomyces sp. BE20]
MSIKRFRTTAVTAVATAAVAALLAGSGTASGATRALSRFDDGSFETPKVAANTFQTLSAGQTIGPWQVTAGSVDLIGAGFWQAAEGDQSVDLNGSNAGTVSQTFTTTPGTAYTVTYSIAGNPDGAPVLKTGQARVDGQEFQAFSFDVTGKTRAAMGYVTRQFTFVATNASTTLAFRSTTAGSSAGPVVDNVQVQACQPCPTCG